MSGARPGSAPGPGNVSSGTPAAPSFLAAPVAAKTLIVVAVATALVLPFVLAGQGQTETKNDFTATLIAVLVISVANIEIGRLLEGGRSDDNRAHKALS